MHPENLSIKRSSKILFSKSSNCKLRIKVSAFSRAVRFKGRFILSLCSPCYIYLCAILILPLCYSLLHPCAILVTYSILVCVLTSPLCYPLFHPCAILTSPLCHPLLHPCAIQLYRPCAILILKHT